MTDWRRQFGALLLVQCLVAMSHGMYVPIVSKQLAALGLSGSALVTWTGFAFAGNFLAMILALPVLGRLGDRIGRKPIMVWSGIGMAIVTSLMSLAGHPAELAALRFLQGCFTGILPFAMILVLTGAPQGRIGLSAGLMQTMGETGSMIGPLIGAAALAYMPANQSFPIMSMLLAAATLVVALLVREPERTALPGTQTTSLLQDIAAIWRRKPFPHLLIGAFCTNFCIVGTSPLLVFYIERSTGSWWPGSMNLGFALAVTSLAIIVCSPLLGRLADRVGPLKLLRAATATAVLLCIIQALTHSYTLIVLCRFLMGVCAAGMLPNIQAQIRRHVEPGMESRTFGITNAWQFMGSLAGPTIGGVIAAGFGVNGWFWAIALVFAVSLWQAFQIGWSVTAAEGGSRPAAAPR